MLSKAFIIRHAEKPDDDSDIHLSPEGWERAIALVELFGPNGRLARAQYLIAADKSRHSNRCVETLKPLSDWLSLDIDHHFEDDEWKDLAKRLLSGKKYQGATVLVCWHHGSIPALARALGVRAGDLPWKVWPDVVFDRVWVLDWSFGAVTIWSEAQGLGW